MNRLITLLLFCPILLFGQYPVLDQNFATSGHFYYYSNFEFSGASGLGFQSDRKIDSAFGNDGVLLSNLPSSSNYFNIQVLDSMSFIASGSWGDSNSAATLVSKYFLNSYLGVEETGFSSMRIYPNPTAGLIKIHSAIEQEVRIFNPFGQPIWVGKIESNTETQINLDGLPNGVYIVKTEFGETEKLVIQH